MGFPNEVPLKRGETVAMVAATVCAIGDDAGIPLELPPNWDSNLTDEYYTAVTAFNLSWNELVSLGRNSLSAPR